MNNFFNLFFKRKWYALLTLVFLLFTIGSGISKLKLNLNIRSAAASSKKTSSTERNNEKIKPLPSNTLCFVRIRSKQHTILNKNYINKLNALSNDLRKIPGVKKIDNILTLKSLFHDGDGITSSKIIDILPNSTKDLNRIKKRFLDNKTLKRDFVSPNFKTSTIVITLFPQSFKKDQRASKKIENTLKKYSNVFGKTVYVGTPRIGSHATTVATEQIPKLLGTAIVFMLMMVFVITRSFSAMLITAFVMIINIVLSLGAMGYLHLNINILSTALPIIIIVIGSTEVLHLLCGYIKSAQQSAGNPSKAVTAMIKNVYKSAIMTSTTTIIGFLSFSFSSSPVVSEFGLSGALAMFICAIISLCFTPTLLAFFPGKNKIKLSEKKSKPNGYSIKIGEWICQHSKRIIFASCALSITLIMFCIHLRTDSSMFETLTARHPVSTDIRAIRDDLGGVTTLTLYLKGPTIDSIVEAKNLNNIMRFGNALLALPGVNNVYSFADVIATLNQKTHNNQDKYYKIPDSNENIHQLLTLIDIDNYQTMINYDLDTLYLKIRFKMTSRTQTAALEMKIKRLFDSIPHNSLKLSMHALYHKTHNGINTIVKEGLYSLITCVFMIFILFCIQFHSVKSGLLSMLANCSPLFVVIFFMVILGINLDTSTIVALIIVLSICVDDTIHFFTKFSHFSQHNQSVEGAVKDTLSYEFLPLMTTSFATVVGMLILMASHLTATYQLGLIIAFGVFFAMFYDLILTPALLSQFKIISFLDLLTFQYDTKILKNSPVFKGMTKNDIKKITLLSYIKNIEKGEQIIKKGDDGNEMFVLLQGEIEVELEKSPCIVLSSGDAIGEMAYFSNEKRTANCYAKQDCALMVFDEKCMTHSLRMHKRLFHILNRNIVSIIIRRLT